MRLIDLSQPLYDNAPNCPAHPAPKSERTADHAEHGWRMEVLTMASHTGSHVDAPIHKIAGGKSLSEMPLDTFMGLARIADLRPMVADQPITAADLERTLSDLEPDEIALLCTGWGEKRAQTDEWLKHSPYLSPDGAEWLVARGARAVGIDHYSVGGCHEPINSQTHTVLLGNGLWVVEELHFVAEAFQAPRPCLFLSLPINLKDHSGAYCRPVLMVEA